MNISLSNKNTIIDFLQITVFGTLYFIAHIISFFFPDTDTALMIIWPAGGVGLAAFLLCKKRLWLALTITFYAVGIIADVFFAHRLLLAGIGYMTGNMAESIGSAWVILNMSDKFNKFSSVNEILALLVAGFLVNAVSSCIGAFTSVLLKGAAFFESWLSWYISDGLGILLITPFILSWFSLKGLIRTLNYQKILEGLFFICAWIIINLIIFKSPLVPNQISLHPYVLIALLLWPAVRFGLRGVSLALVITFFISVSSSAITNGPSPFMAISPDKVHRLLDLQIFFVCAAIVGYILVTSYSDLKKTENTLRESEEKYRLLLSNISDLVCEIDENGVYTYVNENFKDILGYEKEELLGRQAFELIHPDDLLNSVKKHEIIKNELGRSVDIWRFRNKKGEYRIIESKGAVYKNSKNELRTVVISRDITAQRQSEFDLKEAKEKAEESDRLKTAFLQNMSHEIRTPMNAIKGFADLLIKEFDNKEKLEKFARIISQRSSDLLDIINDILDISRIESGQLAVNKAECNINTLFEELSIFFSEFQQRIGKQHIKFNVQNDCYPEYVAIITDKVKLKQVFINLISNALKFTDQGEINVGCKFQNKSFILFFVADTGFGIPKDKQRLIFDRFIQLNEYPKRNIGGNGLGLSIVKGLVTLLGGEISIESEINRGSTFSFTLPITNDLPNN